MTQTGLESNAAALRPGTPWLPGLDDMQITILGTRAMEPLRTAFSKRWESAQLIGKGQPTEVARAMTEWVALRDRVGPATRFNDPARFLNWLNTDGGTEFAPCVLLVGRSERTLAVLSAQFGRRAVTPRIGPVRLRTPKVLSLYVPETGVILDDSRAAADALTELLLWLLVEGPLEQVELRDIGCGGLLHAALWARMREHRLYARERKIRWITRMLDTVTGQRLQHHSSKSRATFKRADRRLREHFNQEVELLKIERVDQVDGFVAEALKIQRETYQAELGIGVRGTPEFRAFLAELARTGCLRAYLLRGGGEMIAYVVGDLSRQRWSGFPESTFSLVATAFLPRHGGLSPGTVLLCRVIEDLAAERVVVFDFGWGDAEYKRRLGSAVVEEEDLRLYGRHPRAALAGLIDVMAAACRRVLDQALHATGVRGRLRKWWRERLRRRVANPADSRSETPER